MRIIFPIVTNKKYEFKGGRFSKLFMERLI